MNNSTTMIVINTICLEEKDVDKIMDILKEHDLDYKGFTLEDDEAITLTRNMDYIEPDPDSKDGRF